MNKILAAWAWNGPVSEPIAYGEGHINQTYALTEQATQKRYILPVSYTHLNWTSSRMITTVSATLTLPTPTT